MSPDQDRNGPAPHGAGSFCTGTLDRMTCKICDSPKVARGLCRSHYNKAYAAGEFWDRAWTPPPKVDMSRPHRIVEKDLEARTGVCVVCGPVDVYVKPPAKDRTSPKVVCSVREKARRRDAQRRRRGSVRVVTGACEPRRGSGATRMKASERAALLDSQGGVCAVCGASGELHLDHDHGTGKLREFLCHGCNVTLGFVEDDPKRLRALADYLERHRE